MPVIQAVTNVSLKIISTKDDFQLDSRIFGKEPRAKMQSNGSDKSFSSSTSSTDSNVSLLGSSYSGNSVPKSSPKLINSTDSDASNTASTKKVHHPSQSSGVSSNSSDNNQYYPDFKCVRISRSSDNREGYLVLFDKALHDYDRLKEDRVYTFKSVFRWKDDRKSRSSPSRSGSNKLIFLLGDLVQLSVTKRNPTRDYYHSQISLKFNSSQATSLSTTSRRRYTASAAAAVAQGAQKLQTIPSSNVNKPTAIIKTPVKISTSKLEESK